MIPHSVDEQLGKLPLGLLPPEVPARLVRAALVAQLVLPHALFALAQRLGRPCSPVLL